MIKEIMEKSKVSKKISFKGWNVWSFLKGRKKLAITFVGLFCAQLAFNPELTGLLTGGAVFEGVWGILEYFFKEVEIK